MLARSPSAFTVVKLGSRHNRLAMLLALHPVLASYDLPFSIRFYQRLGFTLTFTDSAVTPRYAALTRDRCELHLQHHDAKASRPNSDRPTYRILVTDPDQLFREFESTGIAPDPSQPPSPYREPADTPWHTREFHLRDPSGNGLQFYAPR